MSIERLTTAILLGALTGAVGCKVKDPPPITERFVDDFERSSIGGNYYPTGGNYQIVDGQLIAKDGFNHPLWLRKALPRDVAIEVDVWAETDVGDLKVELFGDGRSHAKNKGAYRATGYVAIFGGWNNSKSILARKNEHGKELVIDRTRRRVEKARTYHWKIVRQGGVVEWFIDGASFLRYEDPRPLEGPGHRYFAFNNWQSPSRFDNLSITPL